MIERLRISRLSGREISEHAAALVKLAQDAVANGAQLGWEDPLDDSTANTYWESRIAEVDADNCVFFAAFANDELVGTVQLERGHFEMSRHRGEIAKLIVRSDFRRQGIALRLMSALEEHADAHGFDLLFLDTRPGEPVEHLYRATGYTATGFIPKWLKNSDGTYRDNVFYFKVLK